MDALKLKDKLDRLAARKRELTCMLAEATGPPPILHPSMAEVWRQKIDILHRALQDDASKAEAFELLAR